jgi:hypothetical protein
MSMRYFKYINESYRIDEIGDASAKVFKYTGPNKKDINNRVERLIKGSEGGYWSDPYTFNYRMIGGKSDYDVRIKIEVQPRITLDFSKKPKKKLRPAPKVNLSANIGFDVAGEENEKTTNLGEQFRVLATVTNIVVEFLNTCYDSNYYLQDVWMVPKADAGEVTDVTNKRGRFYEAYIRKQLKRVKGRVSVTTSTIRDDGKTVQGFVLKQGHWYGGKEIIRNESIVNEIGDRSVEPGMWLQSKYEPNHKGYSFVTRDEERYYAYFEKKPWKWLESQGFSKILPMKMKAWETSFGHLKGSMHGYGGELDFKSATNKGSQFEILSTYAEILEDFLKNNKSNVDVIIAKPEKSDSKDSRRLRLYQAFLDKTNIFKKVKSVSVFGQDIILLYP